MSTTVMLPHRRVDAEESDCILRVISARPASFMIDPIAATPILYKNLCALVLLIPEFWFPQLYLVSVWIHDPSELPILMRLRATDHFDSSGLELREHLV